MLKKYNNTNEIRTKSDNVFSLTTSKKPKLVNGFANPIMLKENITDAKTSIDDKTDIEMKEDMAIHTFAENTVPNSIFDLNLEKFRTNSEENLISTPTTDDSSSFESFEELPKIADFSLQNSIPERTIFYPSTDIPVIVITDKPIERTTIRTTPTPVVTITTPLSSTTSASTFTTTSNNKDEEDFLDKNLLQLQELLLENINARKRATTPAVTKPTEAINAPSLVDNSGTSQYSETSTTTTEETSTDTKAVTPITTSPTTTSTTTTTITTPRTTAIVITTPRTTTTTGSPPTSPPRTTTFIITTPRPMNSMQSTTRKISSGNQNALPGVTTQRIRTTTFSDAADFAFLVFDRVSFT